MDNESTPKPWFRWGRLLLILVMACLLMVIGYVGGNILHRKLTKKLDEIEDKTDKEVEDIEHEDVDEEEECEALTEEEDEKASMLLSGLLKDALPDRKEKKGKTLVIGFRPAAKKTVKKK